jgi:hypothetical protein
MLARNKRNIWDPGCAKSICRGLVAVVAATCLLTASSCSQSDGKSASKSTSANRGIGTLTVNYKPVLLLPTITGGDGGWCVTLSPGECPTASPVRTFHNPIVAESWGGQGSPSMMTGFVLTASEVAAVSVDGGQAIPTHAESVLPDNLRAAVIALRSGPVRHVPGFDINVPSISLSSLRFAPLNSKGELLPQAAQPRPPLSFSVPGRHWTKATSAPGGICEMQTTHLNVLFKGGFVASKVTPHGGSLGRPLLSCVSASYLFKNWPLVASVLLDAAHPGSTPAALPGMKPLRGHRGFFQAPVAEGEAVARRIPGAWLVVAHGSGNAQRLLVLKHLRATVHL